MPSLTLDQAKSVLQQIVDELKTPKLQSAIHAARKEAGADVNAMMQEVVPIFYEVQGKFFEPLGFVPDDDGFADFADELKKHESDAAFNELSKELKKIMKESVTPLPDSEDEGEEEEADREE